MSKNILIPKYLGCQEDLPDSRDISYGYSPGRRPSNMPSFKDGYDAEEKYGGLKEDHQDQSLACTCFGGTSDIEMTIKIATGQNISLSPRWGYSQIHLPNGGGRPRDVYKLANKSGFCEEHLMPTYRDGHKVTESWMRSKQGMDHNAVENALQWKIGAYRSIRSLDPEVVAQAIFESGGVGGGYKKVGLGMGHFVYLKGYGMIGGRHAIKIKDSYEPFEKHLIYKQGRYYLGSTRVQLFSLWLAEINPSWTTMVQLYRKKGRNQVVAKIGNDAYWFEDITDFENLSVEIPWLKWGNVKDVDEFPFSYTGRTIGKSNFSDLAKELLAQGPVMKGEIKK